MGQDNEQIQRLGTIYGRKYDSESSVYVLREDDNVTLSFQTSEQIDQPDVTLSIGGRPVDNSSYSVFFDHEGGTAQGTSWKASYRIRDNDSGVLSGRSADMTAEAMH